MVDGRNEENKEQQPFIFGPNVGQNDKYLITKLRSYNITLDKIDSYLSKLSQDIHGMG